MKKIKLTKGYVAIVDDDDYEWAIKRKWQAAVKDTGHVYARGWIGGGKKSNTGMHRIIMNAKKGQIIDHRNGNTLDNRKENLRFCTKSENSSYRVKRAKKTSKYLGVCYSKARADRHYLPWLAQIQKNNRITIRFFKSEIEAAKEYDLMATKLHGEFASLNFPHQ